MTTFEEQEAEREAEVKRLGQIKMRLFEDAAREELAQIRMEERTRVLEEQNARAEAQKQATIQELSNNLLPLLSKPTANAEAIAEYRRRLAELGAAGFTGDKNSGVHIR